MTVVNDAERVWQAARSVLELQVSEAVWHSVFSNCQSQAIDDQCLTISVPNDLVRDRVETRYRELILGALGDTGHPQLDLEVTVVEPPFADADDALDEALGGLRDDAIGQPIDGRDRRDHDDDGPSAESAEPRSDRPSGVGADVPWDANNRFTFDTFVTGPSNRFATAAALSVAETPARSYNPLFIYGAAGLGKTHLLRAIAHYVQENYPTYRVRYISTETMMNEFIEAIRDTTMAAFKRRYRETDVLLVDDVQFLEGRDQLQEEFFHTFNTLQEANRQIVLSSDRPPDAVATLEDRLRSRFKMGLVTDVQPPDFETRLAILHKKSAQLQGNVPNDVLEFIVTHVTNNIRELEGALNRVNAYATLTQSEITFEDAQHVLGDLVATSTPRRITPELILETTAAKYGFTVAELEAQDRRRPLVLARQVGMYLFRELTELSYPDIATYFGGRDHTTIIYGFDKIRALMGERQNIYDDVTSLIAEIRGGPDEVHKN